MELIFLKGKTIYNLKKENYIEFKIYVVEKRKRRVG